MSLGVNVVGRAIGVGVGGGRLSVRLNEMGALADDDDDGVRVVFVVVAVAVVRVDEVAVGLVLVDPPAVSPNIYAPAVSSETRAKDPLEFLLSPPPLPPPLLLPLLAPPLPLLLPIETTPVPVPELVAMDANRALFCCRCDSRKASVTEVITTCMKSNAHGRPPCVIEVNRCVVG